MIDKELEVLFQEAFDEISNLKEAITPDVMLKFYAFYKQANFGNNSSYKGNSNLRNGFKFNAWQQLNGMTSEEAKREYITLTNIILTEQKQKK